MKRLIPILLTVLSSCTCHNNWVQELESKNPLKDSTNYISVYFRFDTIINDFEVSGILYPYYSEQYGWSMYENGVRLFFHSCNTNKEYIWTDFDETCQCFKNTFMSKNVFDIVTAQDFQGFKNGDSFTFKYNAQQSAEPENPLLPNAEYQFYDIDFDGKDELLLNYYHGGPRGGSMSEIYEITDTALILKYPVGSDERFAIDENTIIDADTRTITQVNKNSLYCEDWSTTYYQADNLGELHLIYSISYHFDQEKDSIICDSLFYN